jgi:hypothetical protein
MSTRTTSAGMSLLELSALIAVSGLLLSGTVNILTRLQRMSAVDTTHGTRAELTCDQLRRDLAEGPATPIPGGVLVGHIAWRSSDGYLVRGERQMLRVGRFEVAEVAGSLTLTIVPVGLPARQIEVLR